MSCFWMEDFLLVFMGGLFILSGITLWSVLYCLEYPEDPKDVQTLAFHTPSCTLFPGIILLVMTSTVEGYPCSEGPVLFFACSILFNALLTSFSVLFLMLELNNKQEK